MSNKEINDRVREASKTDMWALGFLEKTQNYSSMSKSDRLKEYREYLKDPEEYWHKDLSKKYEVD